MSLTALAVADLLTSHAAAAAQEPPVVCRRDGDTFQINACLADDLVAERARLERYLDAARARAAERDRDSGEYGEPTRQLAWLEAAHTAWEAYADIRCDGVFDRWSQGTVRTAMALDCHIDATRQRTHDIWSDYLTYADSTPPDLPEPTGPVVSER